MPPTKIPEVKAGIDLQSFRDFIRSLVSDKTPNDEDLFQIFKVYDKDQDGILCEQEAVEVNHQIVDKINKIKAALIVVDFQNDFVDGSLAIKRGRAQQDPMQALQILNGLLSRHKEFDSVIYTLDWHPSNHISFYEHCRNNDRVLQHSDKTRKLKPFDIVTFKNPQCTQVLYPSHCVKNSWGAELNAGVMQVQGAKIVRKGTDVYVDAYSGFGDNNGRAKSDLEKILRADDINAVFICGLALDICVASTARDASKLKFLTCVVQDCCKGLNEEQIKRTCNELRGRNVPYIQGVHVDRFLNKCKVPWLWICQMSGLGERRYRQCKRTATDDGSPNETNVSQTPHGSTESMPENCQSTLIGDS